LALSGTRWLQVSTGTSENRDDGSVLSEVTEGFHRLGGPQNEII